MGVTGLWTVVQPCARPVRIETLNRKRLAVDASIWIYQFLKAVRDKEGNALRNAHVVGFFRRICKLLYFGIKPVFVFDGGAPALKRATISKRKGRREGRREDAVKTAGKLLALQMQRIAEEDAAAEKARRQAGIGAVGGTEDEEALPEDLVYVDELQMSAKERQQNRGFKKKDQYHLPDLDVAIESMGAPNDPRIMSQEELEEYARQFNAGEDINLYDFSNIDFDSAFFLSLPDSDRYNILNAARLRSRLRMGYSKEQLDTMFPDRMAFSRFQIERVKERNDLTQRLMNLNGMNSDLLDAGGRVAGEKGKEYILVRNDGAEGGWALGVISDRDAGKSHKPIELDREEMPKPTNEDESAEEDEFEDVPVEGLNRLPQRLKHKQKEILGQGHDSRFEEIAKKRQAVYEARKRAVDAAFEASEAAGQDMGDADVLFVPDNGNKTTASATDDGGLFEDVGSDYGEDEDLQRAIQMSLEGADELAASNEGVHVTTIAEAPQPRLPPAKRSQPFLDDDEDDDDFMTALHSANTTQLKPKKPIDKVKMAEQTQKKAAFSGPLPFQSMSLGSSFLKKKRKSKEEEEEEAGGFERESDQEEPAKKKAKPAEPLPPWFTSTEHGKPFLPSDENAENMQRTPEEEQLFEFHDRGVLATERKSEYIDLDRMNSHPEKKSEVIDLENMESQKEQVIDLDSPGPVIDNESPTADSADDILMEDVAELTRENPPQTLESESNNPPAPAKSIEPVMRQEPVEVDEEEVDVEWDVTDDEAIAEREKQRNRPEVRSESSEFIDVDLAGETTTINPAEAEAAAAAASVKSEDEEDDFEDVNFSEIAPAQSQPQSQPQRAPPSLPQNESTLEVSDALFLKEGEAEEDDFSDPEDEDLFRKLAEEAEEHARFATSLNANAKIGDDAASTRQYQPQLQTAFDYEQELKQLRSQQKKDRRDADEVTQVMITECQQLLKLFGLPYITAPMEAEAQCAELVRLGLVDGIVTDDSDVFLFGGTRVYKNMFNQAKFVECYLAADLVKEYALDREKMIRFAHLLGSDYTEGIPGVGPVTALEILTEFATLEEFCDWWTSAQRGLKNDENDPHHGAFRKKFKKKFTKWFLPTSFPDKRVDEAYLKPEVDDDREEFRWGVPNLDALRSYLMATIGWTQERTDEVLVPVIRDMNRRGEEGTQANITRFFNGAVGTGTAVEAGFAPRVRNEGRGRMERAFGRLRGIAAQRRRADIDGDDEADDPDVEAEAPLPPAPESAPVPVPEAEPEPQVEVAPAAVSGLVGVEKGSAALESGSGELAATSTPRPQLRRKAGKKQGRTKKRKSDGDDDDDE